jgi:drug/metabolite transporter (DMT)-like permease
MIHLLALVGALGISFSAVFVRLAAVSPVTATFYRATYALPVLAAMALAQRGRDHRPGRARWLAVASGLMLGLELAFWHESIALIGAGLATVIANVQVVFVAVAAWAIYRERPTRRTILIVAAVLAGIALTSGLAGRDAYGSAPLSGMVFGVIAGAGYAAFLMMFRAANRTLAPASGPLFDSTLGAAIGALLGAPFDPRFAFTPSWPAHGWLLLLALVSQVVGYLLVARALPRLPAVETSIVLLVQPVFALLWGFLFFAERLSPVQWLGAALVLAGVASMTVRLRATR